MTPKTSGSRGTIQIWDQTTIQGSMNLQSFQTSALKFLVLKTRNLMFLFLAKKIKTNFLTKFQCKHKPYQPFHAITSLLVFLFFRRFFNFIVCLFFNPWETIVIPDDNSLEFMLLFYTTKKLLLQSFPDITKFYLQQSTNKTRLVLIRFHG